MRRPACAALSIVLAGLVAAGAAGCGGSGGSTTATSTVPSGQLGAAIQRADCPTELGGQRLVTRSCPDGELVTQAQWAQSGRRKGEDFVVTTADIERDTTGGYVQTVWCPRYDSVPLAGRHWGVLSTTTVNGASARDHRDPRGARGLIVSWDAAASSPSTTRLWIVCRGTNSTYIDGGH
jgi:hypothetical protein